MGSLKIEYAEGAQAYHKCSQPIVLSVDAHLDGVIAIHHEVMNDIPSGLLHPDGVQRIRSISHDIASAKENVACAHSRLTEFLDKGTIPEEFEIVLVVLIQIMRHDLKASSSAIRQKLNRQKLSWILFAAVPRGEFCFPERRYNLGILVRSDSTTEFRLCSMNIAPCELL